MNPSTARRARYLIQSAILMLAVSAVCVFGVVLASRHPIRLDTTATREHALSERSRRVLAELTGPHEIVLVTDSSRSDTRSLQRAVDVLELLADESPQVSATVIDSSSGTGVERLDAVLQRLVERYAPTLKAAGETIGAASTALEEIGVACSTLAPELQSAADAVSVDSTGAGGAELRRFFADSAAVMRMAQAGLADAASRAIELSRTNEPGTPVPQNEQAIATLRAPVLDLLRQLDEMRTGLTALSQARSGVIDEATRARAAALSGRSNALRDRAASVLLTLDDAPTTPLERCVRAIAAGPTALVIGPPETKTTETSSRSPKSTSQGVTAVNIQSMLAPQPGDDPSRGRLDMRFRVEELLVGGLAVLSTRDAPIVCFVHGEPDGTKLAPEFPPFAALIERLRLRGIDVIEWPAAVAERPPSAGTLPNGDARQIVYVVIPTNALTPDGAVRMKRLAQHVATLASEGKPVLLSLNPSNLPGIGQTDPMVEFLNALGLKPDTGRPILQSVTLDESNTRRVVPDVLLTRADVSSALGEAIQSLRTHLRWSIPLRIDPETQRTSGAEIRTVLTVPSSQWTWAEAEWLGFWQLSASDRLRVANPPTPNDIRDETTGPWTVVAAIERRQGQAESSTAGRIVVVGANAWFFDEFTQIADVVDGRPVPRAPGNTELFEAAVYWLAGKDHLIARSAEALAAPIVRADLSERSRSLLRWSLVAGLPLMVLAIGALWRLVRG